LHVFSTVCPVLPRLEAQTMVEGEQAARRDGVEGEEPLVGGGRGGADRNEQKGNIMFLSKSKEQWHDWVL
jgi:hypothetical protein